MSRTRSRVLPLAGLGSLWLALASQGAGAQSPSTPATATPRPSATTAAPAPGARAADVDPGVDTSAPATSAAPAAAAPTPATPAAAARPAATNAGGAPDPKAQAAARPRGGRAMDRVDLESSQITGNRELPRVLYIVPWRAPEAGDIEGRPVNSLLFELTKPVDRDVFRRENRYFDALAAQSPNADASAGEATDGGGPEK